ncbi:DUF445 family protein [bacterium 210820-DFI.6.37]|nr:DUF445 family protein [bacterium 210820-DFI.6.37]
MFVFKLIAGPLIGAVIGYFTNYIAVKMLFKPHHPIRIGGCRLPFTPGLIPKRKDELAGAIGGAVSDVLLTKEDLTKALPSGPIKESITDNLWQQFCEAKESDRSVSETAMSWLSEEQYEKTRDKLEDIITDKAVDVLERMDISQIFVTEGTRVIKEKVQGTMLAMMINDQVIQSMAAPVGQEIQNYIDNHAEEKIRPVVAGELAKLEASGIGSLARQVPLEKRRLSKLIDALYSSCVEGSIETMVEKIDIAGIIEEKIKGMDVEKLEALILSVMKKELNAIVNLGALIGLVIGLLNLVISLL